MEITTLLTIIGLLVALTNIITEVIKKVTWDKIPTTLLTVIVSLALTLVAFFAYCQISYIAIMWYFIVAAVVIGFMVAYAAMFGYDKLKEIFAQWGVIKNE